MARGINKVILVGNAGSDASLQYTGSGTAIATLSIATSESWKDKQTGEQQERTEWHRCKCFGRLGEIAGEYVKKGRQLYIEGKLRTEKYTDKEGVERYSTDIIIDELQLLGADPNRERSAPQGQREQAPAPQRGNGQHPNSQRSNGHAQPAPQRAPQPAMAGGGDWADDGGVPF